MVEKLLVFFVDSNKPAPKITIIEEDKSDMVVLNDYIGPESDIISIGEKPVEVVSHKTGEVFNFSVQVYKIYYSPITSRISLTANKREVTDTPIHQYIPEFKETLFEVTSGKQKNYTVKAYVLGKFLDDSVTVERDGFKINPERLGKEEGEIIADVSETEIEKAAAKVVKEYFAGEVDKRPEEKRAKIINYINESAPWHRSLINDVDIDSMPMGISNFELEMRFQKAKYEREREIKISIHELQEIAENEDNDIDFQNQIHELTAKISIASKNDLAHYVCTRKKVIELFDSFRKRKDDGTASYESTMHNLIYPMGYNSEELDYEDHNLWLLDERLAFSKFTASDYS